MTDKLSLYELQLTIRDSLYLSLPDYYWVTAEISDIKENFSGHCYLELIEKNNDENNVRARVKAVIWSARYRFLKALFENITGESLKSGLKILVKTKVEYHELYGLSLVISDIDPSYTIGEMALRRQLIIKRLEHEGVFSMNKEIEFPIVPQRIAIISSVNAAGYSDFINQLKGNSYGYVFYTALFDSAMQGTETENGILNAFDRIASNLNMFDLVIIIRGGGSQTDLSWFDNYNIAYHITQFPLPVITGIGHDKDMSVTDMVANRSLKTPTAVADFLIECLMDFENQLLETSSEIKGIALLILENNQKLIDTFRLKLVPLARIIISLNKEKLNGKIIETINNGKESIFRVGLAVNNQVSRLGSGVNSFSSSKRSALETCRKSLISGTVNSFHREVSRLDRLENNLSILNPDNVLRRGYTITTISGRILKTKKQIMTDEVIDTQFSDGTVSSRILGK